MVYIVEEQTYTYIYMKNFAWVLDLAFLLRSTALMKHLDKNCYILVGFVGSKMERSIFVTSHVKKKHCVMFVISSSSDALYVYMCPPESISCF